MDIFFSADEKLLKIYRLASWGNYQKAYRLTSEVLESEPDSAFAHYIMAIIRHYCLFDSRNARRHYELAIRFDPQFAVVYPDYLKLLNELNDSDAVEQLARRALTTSGVCPAFVYNERGLSHEKNGRYEEAIACYTRGMELAVEDDLADGCAKNAERAKKKLLLHSSYVYHIH